MKTIRKCLLLVTCLFLIGLCPNTVKADDPYTKPAYFGYSLYHSRWGLWEDDNMVIGNDPIEYDGKGDTWSVDQTDIKHPILTLKNFNLVTGDGDKISFKVIPNQKGVKEKLTIKIKGNCSIKNTFKNDTGTILKTMQIVFSVFDDQGSGQTEDPRVFSDVYFVGDGSSSNLDIIAAGNHLGYSDHRVTIAGIEDSRADLHFKNLNVNINLTKDPAGFDTSTQSYGFACGIESDHLNSITLDNSNLKITVGTKQSIINPNEGIPKIYTDINMGVGIFVDPDSEHFNLELKNNSKLDVTGTILAIANGFGVSPKNTISSFSDYNPKYYTSMNDESSAVSATYNSDTLPVSFLTAVHCGTFSAGENLPIMRIVLGSKPDSGGGHQEKKDESCEKVIGPTWHWNNTKGVCEEYATVGTYTK